MPEYVTIPTWWLVAFPVAWMAGGVVGKVVNTVVVRPCATRRRHDQHERETAQVVAYWKKRAFEAERKKEAVG